jgi:hypothetical protein
LHHIYLASKEIERCMPASEECAHQDPHAMRPHVRITHRCSCWGAQGERRHER